MTRRLLARWPLLDLCGAPFLDGWLAGGEERPLATGEVLCEAGTYARWVYVVRDGGARVLRQGESGKEVSLGVLGPGEVFGEYAMLRPGVVPATCRAAGPTRVVRLPMLDLKLAVAERLDVGASLRAWLRLHALLRFLRGTAFLGFMSPASFLPLQDRLRPEAIPADHTAQAEGLADDVWFYMRSGSVRAGGELFAAGDCFGTAALAGGTISEAVAVADSEVLALSREDFLAPLDGEGPAGRMSRVAVPRKTGSYPHVAQADANDCGPASLAMAARAHGRSVTLADVRRLLPVGRRGCNMEELRAGAERLGFRARAVRIGADQLAEIRPPAVALVGGSHWVVIHAHSPEGVVVGDPATAVKVVPLAAFRRDWAGHVLLLTPPAGGGESLASWIARPADE